MEFEEEVKGRILVKWLYLSKFKEFTLIGMQRMAQRIPTTHATNAHLVCAYADTTSRTLLPLPRAHPVSVHVCSGRVVKREISCTYTQTHANFYTCPSSRSPPSLSTKETDIFSISTCQTP